MNATDHFFDDLTRTPVEEFTDMLDLLVLVDIGQIVSVNAAGRAKVISSKILAGSPVTYDDVEILSLGNNQGGFIVDGTGCACLLLFPRTCMSSVNSQRIDGTSLRYSKNGLKAFPITSNTTSVVTAGFTSTGTFCISAKDGYTMSFTKDQVAFTKKGLTLGITENNNINIYRRNPNSGMFQLSFGDTGISTSFVNKDNTSKYTFDISDSGDITIDHVQPGSSNPINKIVLGADGSVTITSEGPLTVVSKGTVDINNGNLTIEAANG